MPPATVTAATRVVLAIAEASNQQQCLQSISDNTPADVEVCVVSASTESVNRAIAEQAPADVIVGLEPFRVSPGWTEQLRAAARADTNTASASALADVATPLAICACENRPASLKNLGARVGHHSLRLRPSLSMAVGPCIYLRRDAIELVGTLDEQLDLRSAVEIDFAERCLLAGLGHVAADDVLVERLAPVPGPPHPPQELRERYPYLFQRSGVAASAVLARSLAAVRRPHLRLGVTIDGRGLEGALTGTRLHVLELVRALARSDSLSLRVLARPQKLQEVTLDLLRSLPATEILSSNALSMTARSAVVHRPQQTFSSDDTRVAFALGERLVLSQLDLIAYHNPGYFPDATAWQAARRAVRQGLAGAERVVVFSQHTRAELVGEGLVDGDRVRVIPPGLDHATAVEPQRPAALERALGQRGHERSFLLCLGTDFRHKNRVFALRLLAALRDQHGWEGSLVFAGTHIADGSSRELEQAVLAEMGELRNAVIDVESVSESEKSWLMSNAAAVVYPSVYEGFGLVPFEAALSGVPCAFAAQSALAEVLPADLAAIIPWDFNESAGRVATLLHDAAPRERHVQTIADAASQLTWSRAADALVEVYEEAAVAPVRDAAGVSRDAAAMAHDATVREGELIEAHDALVERLVGEREHARGMYDRLNAEVGSGLSLIGPNGALPEDLQHALLAFSARPAVSRPVYRAIVQAFAATRAAVRATSALRRSGR